jgi:uncharacterized membrane protein
MLSVGTWLGCAIIATGLTFSAFGAGQGARVLSVGIGVFIALPVLRVIMMLVHFLKQGERRFAAICAVVLTIIFAGVAAGVWHPL